MNWDRPELNTLRDRRRASLGYTTGRDAKSFSLRVPTDLLVLLDEYATWLGASRNAVITMMIYMFLMDEEELASGIPDTYPA
jgi:hypothetical protein